MMKARRHPLSGARHGWRRICILSVGVCLSLGTVFQGRTAEVDAAFDKSSLAWRTALHFDPGAEAPLTALVNLYRAAGRMGELLELYQSHVRQFPQDEGAQGVLARLLVEMKDARAEDFLKEATAQHPQNALLAHTQAVWWDAKLDGRALDELDRAVALETNASRRIAWLNELIRKAASAQREPLILQRMKSLVEQKVLTPAQQVQWTRKVLDAGLPKAAAALLEGADLSSLTGDEGVEAQVMLARVKRANDEPVEAAKILDAVLEKLAPDHWRRREVLSLRWQTATSETERESLLAEAGGRFAKSPGDEAVALAYGDLLGSAGRRDEAVKVLQQALAAQPASRLLEDRVLELLEQLHRDDDALVFLQQRFERDPQREDLGLRRARWLLMLGRAREGRQALETLLAKADAAQRQQTLLQTARWLRTRNLFGEAASLLESLMPSPGAPAGVSLGIRKELAELYGLLKRRKEMEQLFADPLPQGAAPEEVMEAAQFLISQQMWLQARRMLEAWVAQRPAEFDGRLLLAKVTALQGDEAVSALWLKACRERCDTEARYAAWLAAAWEAAAETESTAALLESERAALFPKSGEAWDPARLSRLSLLAQQSAESRERDEAEKLLRNALASPTLPAEQSEELQVRLLQLLDGQKGREKELENQLNALLKTAGKNKEDLRLRLGLLYHAAQRWDLAKDIFEKVVAAECQDVALLQAAISACRQMGQEGTYVELTGRLLQLKPDDKGLWITWTTAMAEGGNEDKLRSALREMRSLSAKWNLDDDSKDRLRRHLAASYWRTVARVLAADDSNTDARAQAAAALDELEQSEVAANRRLWAVWARGQLAAQSGDTAVQRASAEQLKKSGEPWLDFPDGLTLSMEQAEKLLLKTSSPSEEPPLVDARAPQPPLDFAWGFECGADLQRWMLTKDGQTVLVMDAKRRLHALDRRTGKLRWMRPGPKMKPLPLFTASRRVAVNGLAPSEATSGDWSLQAETVCVLDEAGLRCLRLSDGALLWQIEDRSNGSDVELGALASEGERLFWWQPAQARLDALDVKGGKLLWSQKQSALAETPRQNPQQPIWIATGVDADSGRVMAWGNGAMICDANDGHILWKASPAAAEAATFPLELNEVESGTVLASPAPISSSSSRIRVRSALSGRVPGPANSRLAAIGSFGLPGYGYPGMFGSSQASPWVTWGAEDSRRLHRDGVWVVNPQLGTARYSINGLPIGDSAKIAQSANLRGAVVGFAGRGLVLVAENGVIRVLPTGKVQYLWMTTDAANRPAKHALPAVALSGRTLLTASRDQLQIQDAITGTQLWQGELPPEAASWAKDAWDALDIYQSMRWSGHGVWLYDGQNRTIMVDWKALAADGDWIIPAGVRKLMCLRGQTGGSGKN